MKRFVLLFFALLGYSLHATGQEQRIAGFIYATDPTEAIPFASLWLYDPATGEPEYGTLTSVNGYYELDAIAIGSGYPAADPANRDSLCARHRRTALLSFPCHPQPEGSRYRTARGNVPSQTDCPRCPDDRGSLQPYSGHNLRRWLSDRRKRWYGMSYVQRTYPNKSDGIRDTHECIDCSQRNTYRILSVRLCGNSLL